MLLRSAIHHDRYAKCFFSLLTLFSYMENVELFFNDVFENSPIKLHFNNLIKPNIENSQALPCSTSLGISNIGLKKKTIISHHI